MWTATLLIAAMTAAGAAWTLTRCLTNPDHADTIIFGVPRSPAGILATAACAATTLIGAYAALTAFN